MEKQNKIKILALFGKSASGKDTIQKWITSTFPNQTHGIISCTTRPPRSGEENGQNYFFLTNEEFSIKVLDGSMLEATAFRDWFYGTALDQLDPDKLNVGVFNIEGINCLLSNSDLQIFPIWVYASGKTRLKRSLEREKEVDCVEVCRRFLADEKDFTDIDFDYSCWINETEEQQSYDYRNSQYSRILSELGQD